jgi:hypothetical protein
MAKKFDGSGVVKIQTSEGAFARMKLENMPTPRDWGQIVDGQRYVYLDRRGMGVDGERYRVRWTGADASGGTVPVTSSFSLSGGHINETLFVLAEFLRDQGVEFVAITNKHGNAFGDVRLQGTNLAYLTRTVPHSPACHADFFVAD